MKSHRHYTILASFIFFVLLCLCPPLPAENMQRLQVNNTQVSTADQIDSNDPYYYYYSGKRKSLNLDTTRIAIKETYGIENSRISDNLSLFGISEGNIKPHSVGGWFIITLPVSLQANSNIHTLISQLTMEPGIEFVSPIFIGSDGGPIIITPDILMRFHVGVSVKKQEIILSQSISGTVKDKDWGRVPGTYRIQSTYRSGFAVLAAANALAERPEVKYAEPDMMFTVRSFFVPGEPAFRNLWGLHNTGQSGGTKDMDMDAPEAWDITTGSTSVVVVIIDNGVQQDHPDINQIPGTDLTPEKGDGGPSNKCDNHGTLVAGCVSAPINGFGIAGIAPSCNVASARTSISNVPCNGTGMTQASWIVNALTWAEDIGARVTNNSNGYSFHSNAIDDKYLETHNNGLIHFVAAGNDSAGTISYPSNLPSVYAVSALDRNGKLASFSNHGPGLDFSAPGVSIYTTDRTGSSGVASGNYAWVNGTSFASPYAAGVAALLISRYPWLDIASVDQLMKMGSVDLGPTGYDTSFGWGFVNAYLTLMAGPGSITLTAPNKGISWQAGTNQTISWNYSAMPGNYVDIYLYKGGNNYYQITSNIWIGSGGRGSYTWSIPYSATPGTDYAIRVVTDVGIEDYSNNFSITSPGTITLTAPNGGQKLQAGTVNEITWSYTGNPGSYVSLYLYKGGYNQGQIASGLLTGNGGKGSFSWLIPYNQTPGADYKIRIVTDTGFEDYSDKNFAIYKPGSITVTSPNGGETWQAGTVQTIRWSYTGNPGTQVRISLYKGGTYAGLITSNVWKGISGTGSFNWSIPYNSTPGADYKIGIVTDTGFEDYSNGNFSISAPGSITVTSPNGGETWQAGTVQTIRWSYTGNPGKHLTIYLYKNWSYVTWIVLDTWIENSGKGSFKWSIPSSQTAGDDYEIKIVTDNGFEDYSDSDFTIK